MTMDGDQLEDMCTLFFLALELPTWKKGENIRKFYIGREDTE